MSQKQDNIDLLKQGAGWAFGGFGIAVAGSAVASFSMTLAGGASFGMACLAAGIGAAATIASGGAFLVGGICAVTAALAYYAGKDSMFNPVLEKESHQHEKHLPHQEPSKEPIKSYNQEVTLPESSVDASNSFVARTTGRPNTSIVR
jgi:hypothetical protein